MLEKWKMGDVFCWKSGKWGVFFVKSGPCLNAGCILYSNSIFYFTFYLFGGAYAPNAPPLPTGLVCARVYQGITPILPIFREGILNGSAEVKESAAVGLTELIRRTSADALKPSVVNITGPLIRILGDRFGSGVKTAMLDTLTLLLSKVFITTSLHLTPYTTPSTKSCVRP